MEHTNTYLFKALDAFPYNLEEAIEALHYALSYDAKNTLALCLMGRVYAETLKDYETAKTYFSEALAEDIHVIEVYPHYIDTLLWNEDWDEAQKLIGFALTVKGSDKGLLYLKQAIMWEKRKNYKKALKSIKNSRVYTYNQHFINTLQEEKERIKSKMPKVKKKKLKKKSKK